MIGQYGQVLVDRLADLINDIQSRFLTQIRTQDTQSRSVESSHQMRLGTVPLNRACDITQHGIDFILL